MKTIASIPPNRLMLLNEGLVESTHLTEQLAIDQKTPLDTIFPKLTKQLPDLTKLGIVKRTAIVAKTIYEHFGFDIFETLRKSNSDTIRAWACFLLSYSPHSFEDSLTLITDLADDQHFGVRESAWLALREKLINNLAPALATLTPLTKSPAENIRRFASELTRPRGVWCQHIVRLKENPELASHLLENLKQDTSRYVQNSVANWLNDASKSHPKWVIATTQEWLEASDTPETNYICKGALRSLKKKN